MDEQFTTRQVAQALSVSESSVKRWCDSGAIPTIRTVGGHRRIPMDGLLQFLEQTNRQVQFPLTLDPSAARWNLKPNDLKPDQRAADQESNSVAGVETVGSAEAELDLEGLQAEFLKAIESGDEAQCRTILSIAYGRQRSIATVGDQMVANALHRIGERWGCGDVEIFQERRACEISSRLLHEFRRLIPAAPSIAPLAIGGSPAGDHYSTPSQLVDLVLREAGWRTMNLGSNLPLPTIAAAATQHRPKLIWLSVSYLEDPQQFVEQYEQFRASLPSDLMVVMGGRALTDSIRPRLSYTAHCDSMRQLAAFASALHGKRPSIESSSN